MCQADCLVSNVGCQISRSYSIFISQFFQKSSSLLSAVSDDDPAVMGSKPKVRGV